MQILLAVILASCLLFLTWWYMKRRKYIKSMEKIPGPSPLPIVGNALDFVSPREILPKFLEYSRTYGGLLKLHIGQIPNWLLITDYKFAESVLSSTELLDKPPEYRFFSNWLGEGLSIASKDLWRKHRKILTPTFHFQILEQFIDIFEENSKTLTEKLKKEVGKPSTNVYPFFSLCTLDVVCETSMGISVNAQMDSNSEYVRSVKDILPVLTNRIFNPFLQFTIPYIFTKQYRTEKRCLKFLHGYTRSVINNRKNEMKIRKKVEEKEDETGIKRRLAFLDLLLEENERNILNDKEILDEVNSFMFAGHDTTTSALSFTIYNLAENLDVQKKVVNELREIFADDKLRKTTSRDLKNMKYLEAVIKETLRLYPSLPFFSRILKEETAINGLTLPKDLVLIIFAYGIHRNPQLFPDPEKFLPERFLIENTAGKLPYAYVPFSAGPRNCIGQRFAMMEMKMVLSTILKRYEVLPTVPKHNPELTSYIMLTSENGVCIRLVDRKF